MPRVFVEPVCGVDQSDHAVLDEVADVDRIRHRRRHASRERLDEGDARDDSAVLMGGNGLGAHASLLGGIRGIRESRVVAVRTIAMAIPTVEAVCRHATQASISIAVSCLFGSVLLWCSDTGTSRER